MFQVRFTQNWPDKDNWNSGKHVRRTWRRTENDKIDYVPMMKRFHVHDQACCTQPHRKKSFIILAISRLSAPANPPVPFWHSQLALPLLFSGLKFTSASCTQYEWAMLRAAVACVASSFLDADAETLLWPCWSKRPNGTTTKKTQAVVNSGKMINVGGERLGNTRIGSLHLVL